MHYNIFDIIYYDLIYTFNKCFQSQQVIAKNNQDLSNYQNNHDYLLIDCLFVTIKQPLHTMKYVLPGKT